MSAANNASSASSADALTVFDGLSQCITEQSAAWDWSIVLYAVFWIFYSPLQWNAIGRLEYNTKCFSRHLGRYGTVYLFTLIIFFTSGFRDYVFRQTISDSYVCEAVSSSFATLLASPLYIFGAALVLGSTYQLGIVGTYLGDYCGILMDAPVTAFPFNVVDDPMYVGATVLFLADSIAFRSLVGLFLTVVVIIVYVFVTVAFEAPFLTMVYSAKGKKSE